MRKPIRIAFHTPNLNFRGSCVALRDYALYNEILLQNESIIVTDYNQKHTNDDIALKWFITRFRVFFYTSKEHLKTILQTHCCDLFYTIKYGHNDGLCFTDIPTIVHCVFDMTQPHGTVYAGVSQSLAKKFNSKSFVPHMISMVPGNPNDHLRNALQIPSNAIVFGRHGGQDTFNLQFAKSVMSKIVRQYDSIYFVFINAPQWDDHPQIIYLPPTTDILQKQRFISTCDAMIVPETMGHTFGMSIAEFSIHQKPVICYNGNVWNTAHIDILGDKGIYFQNENQLYNILTTFDPKQCCDKHKDWNAYRSYSPPIVMQQFKNTFIDPVLN